MNISSVVDNGAKLGSSALSNIQAAANWCGHTIQAGFSNYILPAAQKLYSLAAIAFGSISVFAATSPGVAISIAVSLFIAGYGAFTIANLEATKENCCAGLMWKTIGVAAFVYSAAMTGGCLASVLV